MNLTKTTCPVLSILRRRCGMHIELPDEKAETKKSMHDTPGMYDNQVTPTKTLVEKVLEGWLV